MSGRPILDLDRAGYLDGKRTTFAAGVGEHGQQLGLGARSVDQTAQGRVRARVGGEVAVEAVPDCEWGEVSRSGAAPDAKRRCHPCCRHLPTHQRRDHVAEA